MPGRHSTAARGVPRHDGDAETGPGAAAQRAADLSRLPVDDAGRSARARGDAAVVHGEIRQSRLGDARLWARGRGGGGAGSRAGGGAHRRRGARDRLHLGCHRIQQSRAQGRRPVPSRGARPPGDARDRAQMRAGECPRAGARRLPGDDPPGAARWIGRSRHAGGIARRAHRGGLGHGGAQRGRCAAAARRDRRALPRARDSVSHRRRPGLRQGPDRRRCHGDRPALDLGPQDLRPQGRGRALRAAAAAGAPRAAAGWRRAGAGTALGHAADAADRGAR